MYGSNLTADNTTLRNALDSLRQALASSLGDKCPCSATIAEIESTINSIEQKLNDLILEPSSVIAPQEALSANPQMQLNFAVGPTTVSPQ